MDPTAITRNRAPVSLQTRSLHTLPKHLLKRSRFNKSSLTINAKDLHYFDSGPAGFQDVLTRKNQVYFDRTRYISVLHKINKCILFFRPRRFGKSLTVGMLQHFHGIQYKHQHKLLYRVRQHIFNQSGS